MRFARPASEQKPANDDGSLTVEDSNMQPGQYIPEEWHVWCRLAPRLVEGLTSVFIHAPQLLNTRAHRDAVFAIYASRRERFDASAAEIQSIMNTEEVFIHLANCEENNRKRTARALRFTTTDGHAVYAWPLVWESFRIVANLPRNLRVHQLDWEQIYRHPVKGMYARVLAELIATAMHK